MNDYPEWSDEDLAYELRQLEKDLEYWQANIVSIKRTINRATTARDEVLDEIAKRSQHKGWSKK